MIPFCIWFSLWALAPFAMNGWAAEAQTATTSSLTADNVEKEFGSSPMREILRAFREEHAEDRRKEIGSFLKSRLPQNAEEIRVVYDVVKEMEGSLQKDEQAIGRNLAKLEILNELISKSTDAMFHDEIAGLLEKEYREIPHGFLGGWSAQTRKEALDGEIRVKRLQAVTEAAGKGKNRKALPILRKMVKKGGITAGAAVRAIAEIGAPEDLEEFIRSIRKDDRPHAYLKPYGVIAIERVMKDVDDDNIPQKERNRLAASLPGISSRESIPKFRELLRHKNRFVVRMAAEGLCTELRLEDGELINELAENPNRDVRFEVLNSIDQRWDKRFIPLYLKHLKEDKDAGIRALIAYSLGRHKVSMAKEGLLDALRDLDSSVRANAEYSLKLIEREGNDALKP